MVPDKYLVFFDILTDPENSGRLQYNFSKDGLFSPSNSEKYWKLVGRHIPFLFDEKFSEPLENRFDYLQHYRRDAEEFDYFSTFEDKATNHENRRLHEAILSKVDSKEGFILDIGCGGGWVADTLVPRGGNIISFDVAADNVLKVHEKHHQASHFGLVGDVLNIPIAANTIDTIISAEVIEHVSDTKKFVENILRVLKPGGRAIISTPYKEKIQSSLCIHCNSMTPHNAHLWSFDEYSLKEFTVNADVEVDILSNKALLLLQTHKLFGFLPYWAWRQVDRLANFLLNKPSRIIYTITKIS